MFVTSNLYLYQSMLLLTLTLRRYNVICISCCYCFDMQFFIAFVSVAIVSEAAHHTALILTHTHTHTHTHTRIYIYFLFVLHKSLDLQLSKPG